MTDSPSSILLLRLQSTGSNTNLWGGYLNTALQTIEQAAKGYQSLAVTGDATISWTNYATGNTGQCARLKLTGALTANATLTFPSYMNFMSTDNATTGGFAVTVKCSGGTGVSVSNGSKASLYCDGIDYFNAAPTVFSTGIAVSGIVSGVTAGVANTDATNVAQVASAIAAAGTLTPATVRVSINDTTADYLGAKVSVVGTGAASVVVSTTNPGGNELKVFTVSVSDGGLVAGGLQTASFVAAIGTSYTAPTGGTITLPTATGSLRKITIALFGTGITTLSGKINSRTTFPVEGNQTFTITDTDSTVGWA